MTARLLAVADSDSYVKWAAATVDRLAGAFDGRLVVVRSHLTPGTDQLGHAVAGTTSVAHAVPVLALPGLLDLVRRTRPDVLLVAATGPIAQVVIRAVRRLSPRSVVVTGLPGMSVPATELALRYRQGADAFVVHSQRERREFAALAEQIGTPVHLLVHRLPFLVTPGGSEPVHDPRPVSRVVFAPQAKFPEAAEERRAVLLALGRLAAARPALDVVVKLRALAGQEQTHREEHPYDLLRDEVVDAPGVGAVRFLTGPMRDVLVPGTALVTVSSTAVLEAVDLGLPALVLADFGVGDHNLTTAYRGSGLLGTLDDLAAARFAHASHAWLADNYFHTAPDELVGVLDALRAARVPRRPTGAPVGGNRRIAREVVRTSLPQPAVRRIGRQVRRAMAWRGAVTRAVGSGAAALGVAPDPQLVHVMQDERPHQGPHARIEDPS